MKVRIISSDSMGVRSLATLVEACGVAIAIDAGASIAPRRFSLPPHPVELRRLEEKLEESRRAILESDVSIITHYHYDHYIRDEPDLYRRRLVLAKDIRRDINRSQAIRGYRFIVKGGLRDRGNVEFADSKSFKVGGASGPTIEFSKPVWHGEDGTRLGKVLMVRVLCEGESMVFASDVQGPGNREAFEILKGWSQPRPKVLVISGPPLYLSGYRVSQSSVDLGLDMLRRLISSVRPENLVVDHHLVRDTRYRGVLEELSRLASGSGVAVSTAAGYMGVKEEPLELMRRELWKGGG